MQIHRLHHPGSTSSRGAVRRMPGRRRQRGLGLVEVIIAVAFVAIAILALASTTLAGHRVARTESARGVALQTTRALLERLRSDSDWSGLYARLWERVDPALVAEDATWPLTEFYADLEVPAVLGNVRIRVDVPASLPDGASAGSPLTLREDVALPEFGLPYDLNGDGAIDSASHSADYRALPLIITLHWDPPGEIPQAMRTTVWLRGER